MYVVFTQITLPLKIPFATLQLLTNTRACSATLRHHVQTLQKPS